MIKDDNDKWDSKKEVLTLVPRPIIWAIARVRMYGLNKYPRTGEHGWKNLSIDRLNNAAYRHFLLYLDDPTGLDDESGLPHLWHLACNVAFLCFRHTWVNMNDYGWQYVEEVEDDSNRSICSESEGHS